ncbi:MAG: flagellin C [Mesorhizobium amorphae]|nr:MAG: flagellin C [Mesorhizobium amorphae]
MSSIMTNGSAMTALKALTATNKALETTQARISTGFRVAEAADNAAYWSISTTMRSDNKALSTVKDALGLGQATVDVAYTALNSAKAVMDDIKTKLVAAKQPGIDKAKVQSEITQLQQQLQGIASSASFSGSNWLSVNSDAASYSANQQVVSSFSRSADGMLSIGTIGIDISKVALFDTGAGAGLLEASLDASAGNTATGGLATATSTAGTGGATPTAGTATTGTFASMTLDSNDSISFSIAVDGGAARSVTITKATVDAALSTTNGTIGSAANFATVLTQAMTDAGVTGVTAAASGSTVAFTSATTGTGSTVALSGATASNGTFDLVSVDITNASLADLDRYINGIDKMSETVNTAAADLGAAKKRIGLQTDFVKNLMDAIDRGVGQLVDADMNEESTKLQALQVQQQLGVQALSIANGNSQGILKLFQG